VITARVSRKKKIPISTSQNGDQMKMVMDRVSLRRCYICPVPPMVKIIVVPRLCYINPVPAMVDSYKNYPNCVMPVFKHGNS